MFVVNFIDIVIKSMKENTLFNNNLLLYILSLSIIYFNYIDIFVQTIYSGFNIIIKLIQYIIKKIMDIIQKLNETEHDIIINYINNILREFINRNQNLNYEYLLEKLRLAKSKIEERIEQIESINNVRALIFTFRIIENNTNTNTFEEFINRLNTTIPLKCAALNNQRIQQEELSCNICLETLDRNQLYRELTCNHSFHPHCIDRWLYQSQTCPICRRVIVI